MALDPEALGFDAWGMPIIPPNPPVADDELGFTTDDDGDWTPPTGDLPIGRFLLILTGSALSVLRTLAIRHGLYRFTNRRLP